MVSQLGEEMAEMLRSEVLEGFSEKLKVGLIILLAENGYPPVGRDEVYKEVSGQAENLRKYREA